MESSTIDVIIVGAGLSGLSAARYLQARHLNVIVLEAQNRVGGRTFTQESKNAEPWIDLGASFVGANHVHIKELCNEFNLSLQPVYCENYNTHFDKGRRYLYKGNWPTFGWSNFFAAWDLRDTIRRMDIMSRDVPVDEPWNAPKAKEWDEMTLETYIQKTCWTTEAKNYIRFLVSANNACQAHEVSLLFYLWYTAQGGDVYSLSWNQGGAQDSYIINGSQQLSKKMSELLKDRVKLNKQVVSINYSENDKVIVQTRDGHSYQAKCCILATVPNCQLNMAFNPPLHPCRHQLLQHSPMGSCLKVIVVYSENFWKVKGLNGFITSYDENEPVSNVVDFSLPNKKPALICFIIGNATFKLLKLSPKERKDKITSCLAKQLNSEKALKPEAFYEKCWAEEPFIGGCYTTYYPPGTLLRYGPWLREPIGKRVFVAGSESAPRWVGYMEGAVRAGNRAALEAMEVLGLAKKTEIKACYGAKHKADPWPGPERDLPWLENKAPSLTTLLQLLISSSVLLIAIIIGYNNV